MYHCDELAVCRQEKHPEPNKKHKEDELKKQVTTRRWWPGSPEPPAETRRSWRGSPEPPAETDKEPAGWRTLAEATLTVAAPGTQPTQDAVARAVQCSRSVRAVPARCSPQLAEWAHQSFPQQMEVAGLTQPSSQQGQETKTDQQMPLVKQLKAERPSFWDCFFTVNRHREKTSSRLLF